MRLSVCSSARSGSPAPAGPPRYDDRVPSLRGCLARAAALVFASLASACAPIEPPASAPGCVACEDAGARGPREAHAAPGEAEVAAADRWQPGEAPQSVRIGAPDRWETKRIGAAPAEQLSSGRPARARRVHLELKDTPFDEAARLLSDVGGFAVVVEAPNASPVTASLSDVEPFDALVALAEARGLGVSYARGVAVIGE